MTFARKDGNDTDRIEFRVLNDGRAPGLTGVVSVDPFFAKIIASSWAGSVWLALADCSCTEPGGSKNICRVCRSLPARGLKSSL